MAKQREMILISDTVRGADWLHEAAPQAHFRARDADKRLREVMNWEPLDLPDPVPPEVEVATEELPLEVKNDRDV